MWVPGAMGWVATVGWLALLIGVASPPSIAELTFLGASIFTSGAWPWNLVALSLGAGALGAIGFALTSGAEVVLLRGTRATPADVGRTFALAVICAVPALAAIGALGVAAAAIGPAEFNSPQDGGGPLVRMALRLMPIIMTIAVAAVVGAAVHASAARRTLTGASIGEALRAAPRSLGRAGVAGIVQAMVLLAARIGFLAIAALLLRVLWAPIDQRLSLAGIDLAVALLLVGFVAIWLCLILVGGALHAWGSASWTRVLGATVPDARPVSSGMETPTQS